MTTSKNNWTLQLKQTVLEAHKASRALAQMNEDKKNQILSAVAKRLIQETSFLLQKNAQDLREAKRSGLAPAMIDRLTLTRERIQEMAAGVLSVKKLSDPIGNIQSSWKRPNGLKISKVTVPLGVILIIYESRPNVTVDCAALCLKSGNAVILRGGREAFHTNVALASIFEKTLKAFHVSEAAVSLVKTTDRKAVDFLLKQEDHIQLVIPRGGIQLIRKVVRSSHIPVVKHYQGVCHVYVDAAADLKKASDIIYNAKMQRPGVCNAMETLLVHQKIAGTFLRSIGERLRKDGCELRADSRAKQILPWAKKAKENDFGREFLAKIMAVKVCDDLKDAMAHIQKYGSGHTDAIVTEDQKTATLFKHEIDSAAVMVNASTRFSDGFQFGFGAEIGISTDKIHARGPMGLEGLTSYKYVVEGNGQIRH